MWLLLLFRTEQTLQFFNFVGRNGLLIRSVFFAVFIAGFGGFINRRAHFSGHADGGGRQRSDERIRRSDGKQQQVASLDLCRNGQRT